MTIDEMKILKKQRGYSVAYISDRSGVPVGTLTKIFSGETKIPRRETINMLTEFFTKGEPQARLFGEEYKIEEGLTDGALLAESSIGYGAPIKSQGDYTYEDLDSLPHGVRCELIDGVLYDMSSPTTLHARIAKSFFMQFQSYIMANAGSCEAFMGDVAVTDDDFYKTAMVPDFLVVCDEDKIDMKGINGAPDFVLEIISPSSERRDMVIKKAKYFSMGVREYWIVDPRRECVMVFQKGDDIGMVHPLSGKLGVHIYEEHLQINLDEIGEIVRAMQ